MSSGCLPAVCRGELTRQPVADLPSSRLIICFSLPSRVFNISPSSGRRDVSYLGSLLVLVIDVNFYLIAFAVVAFRASCFDDLFFRQRFVDDAERSPHSQPLAALLILRA